MSLEKAKLSLYNRYKYSAKYRNLEFDISYDLFCYFTMGECYYCESAPYQVHKIKNGYYIYNGLDRLDNKKGYLYNNTIPCCGQCNRMKSNLSGKKFLTQIYKIYHNLPHKFKAIEKQEKYLNEKASKELESLIK